MTRDCPSRSRGSDAFAQPATLPTPEEARAPLSAGHAEARLPRAVARDADAGVFLQLLLVSAVVSVLLTRLYLHLMGFPQLGGDGLHIAHLLWGGVLMLVAVVMLLALLGKRAKRLAAITGGLGFGLFVDELGKFVTSDNNYFFQPTIALIYVVFIALFLVFRGIERRSLAADELLVNATDMLRELVLGGATRAEVVRARRLLDRSGHTGPLAEALEDAIACVIRAPERSSRLVAVALAAWRAYDQLTDWHWFKRAILLVFLVRATADVFATLTAAASQQVSLLTSLVSCGLVLLGVVRLPRQRLAAYRWFERSVLVSIFLTQVVLFWNDQLAAFGGLAWDLVLLGGLRFLIRQEEARATDRAAR